MSRIALKSETGSARILWLIATADRPVTSRDLTERLDTTRSNVTSTLTALYRAGFIARRKSGGRGGEYEYTLTVPEDPI